MEDQGYKGHRAGSRKGKIHQLHDEEGVDTAWVAGKRAGLTENTLRTWFGRWRHEPRPKSPPAKKKPAIKSKPAPATDAAAASAA